MTGTLHTAALTAISAAVTGTKSRTLGERFTDIINVKDFTGVIGNGVNDDTAGIQAALNAAFGTTGSPHGDAGKTTNRPVYFPSGNYKITAPLTVRSVRGGWIFGSGRESTIIGQATANTSCFVTNGMDYSRVEGLSFVVSGTGTAFDYDWDNTGSVALQATTFHQCNFSSNGNGTGLRFGNSGFQGSECLVMNCHFTQLGTGMHVNNFNALQITVVGGNFQSCNFGIKVSSGSVPVVQSTGFQVSGSYDIQIDGGTFADNMLLLNCRSESVNFLNSNAGTPVTLVGCGQVQAAAGDFLRFIGPATLIGCYSQNGRVFAPTSNSGALWGWGNKFDRAGYLVNNQASVAGAINQGFLASRYLTDGSGNLTGATFASLPAAGAATFGALTPVYDSTTATAGSTITGGGANKVLAFCNGTNWVVK